MAAESMSVEAILTAVDENFSKTMEQAVSQLSQLTQRNNSMGGSAIFQSTHSITECDRKIWCFGPQNPHLAIKKYIKRRTNVLKKDISALFIGANPLWKTCALRVRTKSQIINGSSRARVCFAPYTSILP